MKVSDRLPSASKSFPLGDGSEAGRDLKLKKGPGLNQFVLLDEIHLLRYDCLILSVIYLSIIVGCLIRQSSNMDIRSIHED